MLVVVVVYAVVVVVYALVAVAVVVYALRQNSVDAVPMSIEHRFIIQKYL